MPQMSPMLWFTLYIYMLLLMMLFTIILYYFIIYMCLDNYKLNNCQHKSFIFKW